MINIQSILFSGQKKNNLFYCHGIEACLTLSIYYVFRAERNGWRDAMPGTEVQGCAFHYTQAVIGKYLLS